MAKRDAGKEDPLDGGAKKERPTVAADGDTDTMTIGKRKYFIRSIDRMDGRHLLLVIATARRTEEGLCRRSAHLMCKDDSQVEEYDKSGGREETRVLSAAPGGKERQSKSHTPRAHLHPSPTHTISQSPSSYVGAFLGLTVVTHPNVFIILLSFSLPCPLSLPSCQIGHGCVGTW